MTLLVGVLFALLACMVEMVVHFMSDLKTGYCTDKWTLSYHICCSRSPLERGAGHLPLCPAWRDWSSVFQSSAGTGAFGGWMFGYFVYVLAGTVYALVSALLVREYAPYAAGGGIPEIKTILGGVVIKRFLGFWTMLIKAVGMVLACASGMMLGKEGPFVHLSCCVANILTRYFPTYHHNQYKKNEIVSAGAAAGVAGAFGAPIGGVLFSLEEVSSYFPHKTMWRAFFCAIMASLVVQWVDPSQTGKTVQFQTEYESQWSWFELLLFCLVGILGGILGALFIKINVWWMQFRKRTFLRNHPIRLVVIIAFLSSMVHYLTPFMKANSVELLEALFEDCSGTHALDMCDMSRNGETILHLCLFVVVNFFFFVLTNGLALPCGIYVPTLVLGASLGRIAGQLMMSLHRSNPNLSIFESCLKDAPCVIPGVYAIVGAAAALAGVTKMTVCLVVIVFELTGSVTFLLPVMVAVMASKIVSDYFITHSIYEVNIALLGYPFLDAKDQIAPDLTAADAMSTRVTCIELDKIHTVGSLQAKIAALVASNVSGCPVVTSSEYPFIVGYITRSELKAGIEEGLELNEGVGLDSPCFFAPLSSSSASSSSQQPHVDLQPWMHTTAFQVAPNTPLVRIHDMFLKLGLRIALVAQFGQLMGVITKKDILRVLRSSRSHNESTSDASKVKFPFIPAAKPDDEDGKGEGESEGEGESDGIFHNDKQNVSGYRVENNEAMSKEEYFKGTHVRFAEKDMTETHLPPSLHVVDPPVPAEPHAAAQTVEPDALSFPGKPAGGDAGPSTPPT